jgi:hypothetical protein
LARLAVYEGFVAAGFQLASGEAVGRAVAPSPFPAGTLRMQDPHFRGRGVDLGVEVPGLVWGTVNVRLDLELALGRPDITLEDVAWAAAIPGMDSPRETFSFVRCCLAHDDRYYPGMIYYPHPETKLGTNRHDYHVLEVLASRVDGIKPGAAAAVICRGDAFRPR